MVPFAYQRTTRLSLANLTGGGQEDGCYCLYNIGDCLHIGHVDNTFKVRRQGGAPGGVGGQCRQGGKPRGSSWKGGEGPRASAPHADTTPGTTPSTASSQPALSPTHCPQEPVRTLVLNSSAAGSRNAYPNCHDYAPAKDGVDTLVGLGDGQGEHSVSHCHSGSSMPPCTH